MVRLRVEGLSKRYGDFLAVKDVSFEVNDKEFYVVLGPSGCGKSTILNCIAGLEAVTEGKIYYDDELVNNKPPEKRDVAMVFQSFALYPTKNIYDNIAFPLRLRRVPKDQIEKEVEAACAKLKITHILKKRPHELSGGERQRAALARAIVRKPKLFLLDEPLSNIDAKLRQHMRAELIALQNELQITTIYVTHDQVEAMTMADRLMVMDQGKISQIGKPLDVFQKPQNLFVAGFIGTPPMNFFPGSLRSTNAHYSLGNDMFSISVSNELGKRISEKAPDSDLALGIRPQDLNATLKNTDGESFTAEVYAIETLGTETIVDVKVGDEVYKVVAPASFESRIGDNVRVVINARNVLIFDKKTGDAIF